MPRYTSCSGCNSLIRTDSLTLCIVRLITPTSTIWAPIGAMNRPSDVPPDVDSFGGLPVTACTALIAALESGRLRHAALDVFLTEPLPAGDRLTRMENVTLSAHSAFRTPEASEKLLRMAMDIANGLSGT